MNESHSGLDPPDEIHRDVPPGLITGIAIGVIIIAAAFLIWQGGL